MERLSSALLDYKLELHDGSTRKVITHAIYDAHHSPSDPPRLETWEREKKPIAEGGQGKIYIQRCSTAETIRIVKIIRHKDSSGRRRYLQELETMIRFSHQRYSRLFVRMLGWYVFSKDICIVMEYLPQGDMHTFLRQRSALEEGDAQTVTSQILQGISVMHKAGFAHRDVKPQNILIQKSPSTIDSSSWWVKLADFGISKDVNTTLTSVSGMVGTWGYMAPELMDYRRGTSALDYMAGDMWSIGATTLYVMTKLQGAHRQGFSNPEELTRHLPAGGEISTTAREFLCKMLTSDPQLRLDAEGSLSHPWVKDLIPRMKGSRIPEIETVSSSESSESHSGSESEEMSTLATIPPEMPIPGIQEDHSQLPGRSNPATQEAWNEPLSQPKANHPSDAPRFAGTLPRSQKDPALAQQPSFHFPTPEAVVAQALHTAGPESNQLLPRPSPPSAHLTADAGRGNEHWGSSTASPSRLRDSKQLHSLSHTDAEADEHNVAPSAGSFKPANLGASERTTADLPYSRLDDSLPVGPFIRASYSQQQTAIPDLSTKYKEMALYPQVNISTPGRAENMAPKAERNFNDHVPDPLQQKEVSGKKRDLTEQGSAYLSAAFRGDTNLLMNCLRDGVDIETRGRSGGQSALYISAVQGHKDIVRALLDAGAAIDSPHNGDCIPLHAAIYHGHEEIAQLLIQRGANVQTVFGDRGTPLGLAVDKNLLQVITQLLASGADVNSVGMHGLTALHIAAMAGNHEVVRQLLLNNADMEAVMPVGMGLESKFFLRLPMLVRSSLSPLHLAVLYKHPRVVQYLLDFGSHHRAMAAFASSLPSALLNCALIAGSPYSFKILLRHMPHYDQNAARKYLQEIAGETRQTDIEYLLPMLAYDATDLSGVGLTGVPAYIDHMGQWRFDKGLGSWLHNKRSMLSTKLNVGTSNNPGSLRFTWEAFLDSAKLRVFVYAGSLATRTRLTLVAGHVTLTDVLNGLFQMSPDYMKPEKGASVNVLRMGKAELGRACFRFSSGKHYVDQFPQETQELLPDLDDSEDYEWMEDDTSRSNSSPTPYKFYSLFQLQVRDGSELRSDGRPQPRAHIGGVVARLIVSDTGMLTKTFCLVWGPEEHCHLTRVHSNPETNAGSPGWKLNVLITALMLWLGCVHEKLTPKEKMNKLSGLLEETTVS